MSDLPRPDQGPDDQGDDTTPIESGPIESGPIETGPIETFEVDSGNGTSTDPWWARQVETDSPDIVPGRTPTSPR